MKRQSIIRLALVLICLLLLFVGAAKMQALAEQEQLWLHWPLVVICSFWSLVLLLFGGFMTRLPQRNKLIAASSASGLLLATGFMSPFFLSLFIAFVPLLWAEQVVVRERPNRSSKWTMFKLSFNTFFIWNIIATYWVLNAGFAAGVLANVLNALFMTIPFVLFHVVKRQHNAHLGYIAFAALWISYEMGHMNWELSWPWLGIGNSFANLPALVQWYEFTGAFGGALWVLMLNKWLTEGFCKLYDEKQKNGESWSAKELLGLFWPKPILGILLPILLSLGIYFTYDQGQGKEVEIVSVQTAYEPHYVKFGDQIPQYQQLQEALKLASQQLTPNTDYLILPETFLWSVDITRIEASNPDISLIRSFMAPYPKLNVVVGVSSFQDFTEATAPKTSRRFGCRRLASGELTNCRYREYHNTAIQISNQSDSIPSYKKSKLVPGAETLPYVGKIEFLHSLIMDLGGTAGFGLGKQAERAVFKSPSGTIGPLICYESVYGQYVSQYTQKGAQALFIVTNDGWWDNSPGHRQHRNFASLRAIENRRSVVRSANNGNSCFVNSRGDIRSITPYSQTGGTAIRDNIRLDNRLTIYVRFGDLIGRISLLLAILFLLSTIAKRLQGTRQTKKMGPANAAIPTVEDNPKVDKSGELPPEN